MLILLLLLVLVLLVLISSYGVTTFVTGNHSFRLIWIFFFAPLLRRSYYCCVFASTFIVDIFVFTFPPFEIRHSAAVYVYIYLVYPVYPRSFPLRFSVACFIMNVLIVIFPKLRPLRLAKIVPAFDLLMKRMHHLFSVVSNQSIMLCIFIYIFALFGCRTFGVQYVGKFGHCIYNMVKWFQNLVPLNQCYWKCVERILSWVLWECMLCVCAWVFVEFEGTGSEREMLMTHEKRAQLNNSTKIFTVAIDRAKPQTSLEF